MAGRNPWIFFGQPGIRNAESPGSGSRGLRLSRGPSSDVHAVRTEVGDGVDVRAVLGARAGFEVQVGSGDVAGRAGEADLRSRGDGLPDRDPDGRQVAVLGVRAVVHLDHDLVAV